MKMQQMSRNGEDEKTSRRRKHPNDFNGNKSLGVCVMTNKPLPFSLARLGIWTLLMWAEPIPATSGVTLPCRAAWTTVDSLRLCLRVSKAKLAVSNRKKILSIEFYFRESIVLLSDLQNPREKFVKLMISATTPVDNSYMMINVAFWSGSGSILLYSCFNDTVITL